MPALLAPRVQRKLRYIRQLGHAFLVSLHEVMMGDEGLSTLERAAKHLTEGVYDTVVVRTRGRDDYQRTLARLQWFAVAIGTIR